MHTLSKYKIMFPTRILSHVTFHKLQYWRQINKSWEMNLDSEGQMVSKWNEYIGEKNNKKSIQDFVVQMYTCYLSLHWESILGDYNKDRSV